MHNYSTILTNEFKRWELEKSNKRYYQGNNQFDKNWAEGNKNYDKVIDIGHGVGGWDWMIIRTGLIFRYSVLSGISVYNN